MKRLIVWGGNEDLSSHRHIHRAYYNTARKMGIPALWLSDSPDSRVYIEPGDTVLAVDLWSNHIAPCVHGTNYVLHNFDASHPLFIGLPLWHLLRLQVWTKDAVGEKWAEGRQWLAENHTLFQPWGCDLLPEEFLEPVYNPQAQDVTFVGAIWSDFYEGKDLGNTAVIDQLRLLCADRALRFKHLTHVSDQENIAAVRESRLAPSFAGGWQVEHGYLPCRAFKNPAYGALAVTNVPEMRALFGAAHPKGETVEALLDSALRLRRNDYLEMVREQQRTISVYTYRESLTAIDRAFSSFQ